ncbi:uridine kinase family protein [Nonomuraea africana]|uniref:uridine kinase family protein n=1 Tax=Nonomuraea africana TaxID=46171 RepID=UPI0033E0FA1A
MDELVKRIMERPPSCGRTRVVAVDGPAGSGKTTFAARLGLALGAQVVHSDDFPVPWEEGPEPWFAALEEQVLRPLAAGRPGAFRRYDWVRGAYAEPVRVPVAPVLVIEGVGTARRTPFVAFRVWIEAPRQVRMARVLERDGPELEPRWLAWFAAEERWFAEDGTRSGADAVLDGTRPGRVTSGPGG